MKKIAIQSFLVLGLMFVAGLSAQGQGTVTSVGTTALSSAGVVTYSVGEIAVQHVTEGGYILDEGVLPPYVVDSVPVEGIEAAGTLPFNIKVFPNPATDRVSVQLEQPQGRLSCSLYDAQGRCLRQSSENSSEWTIDFKALPQGVYLLTVTNEKNQTNQYRIIKNK